MGFKCVHHQLCSKTELHLANSRYLKPYFTWLKQERAVLQHQLMAGDQCMKALQQKEVKFKECSGYSVFFFVCLALVNIKLYSVWGFIRGHSSFLFFHLQIHKLKLTWILLSVTALSQSWITAVLLNTLFYLQHFHQCLFRSIVSLYVLVQVHMCIGIGWEIVVICVVIQDLQSFRVILIELQHLPKIKQLSNQYWCFL